MAAYEQCRPMHRLARRPQPLRQPAHGIAHFPRPRAPDGRAHGGLDAMRGADPVGERDIPGPVRSGAVVGRSRRTGHGGDVHGAARPALARPGQQPLEHEVRHERRWHDVVLRLARRRRCGSAQQLAEVVVPLPGHEDAVRGLAQLEPCPTGGVTIDDHNAPEARLAPLLRLGELPRVERPVAAATHDRHVAHDDRIGHAYTSPPVTARISPVTPCASSLARYNTADTSSSSSTQRTLALCICARLSAVFMVPGATAFTRMWSSRSSFAKARVSPATADLAAV